MLKSRFLSLLHKRVKIIEQYDTKEGVIVAVTSNMVHVRLDKGTLYIVPQFYIVEVQECQTI